MQEMVACQDDHSFKTILGGTLCTDDFYEGVCERHTLPVLQIHIHVHIPPLFLNGRYASILCIFCLGVCLFINVFVCLFVSVFELT